MKWASSLKKWHENNLVSNKKLNQFIKNLTIKKTSGPLGFSGEFYHMFKEDLELFNIKFTHPISGSKKGWTIDRGHKEAEGVIYQKSMVLWLYLSSSINKTNLLGFPLLGWEINWKSIIGYFLE